MKIFPQLPGIYCSAAELIAHSVKLKEMIDKVNPTTNTDQLTKLTSEQCKLRILIL